MMTTEEFKELHDQNMQPDMPVEDLPLYKWLKGQEAPPGRLVEMLTAYYPEQELRGAFTEDEVFGYRTILSYFWWRRLHNEKSDKCT